MLQNNYWSLEVNIRDFEGEIPQGTLVGFAKVPDGKSDESAMQVEIQESLANEVESMPSPAYSSLSDVSICSPEYLDSQSNVPKPSSSLRKSQSEIPTEIPKWVETSFDKLSISSKSHLLNPQ